MGRRLQTLAAVACMKTMLMIFNFIFWITGIAILALGIWMKVSMFKYLQLSTDYNNIAPYVLIGTGAAIILVGSMACCCTMKGQSFMLYIFSLFLVMVFVLMLIAGGSGYIYRSHLEKGFRVGLTKTMEKYGTTENSNNDKSLDMLQSHLGCCGVHDYSDWFNVSWSHNTESVPLSCCRHQNKDCQHTDIKVNGTETIYTSGCYKKVLGFVKSNLGAIGGGILAVAFFQLIGVMLSYCLARNINKGKYEPVN